MVAVTVTRSQGGEGPVRGYSRGLSHSLKWDHFDILAKSLIYIVKVKETLLIKDLKHTLNKNISSEKLYLY